MTVHKFIKSAHFHFTLEDICFSQVQDISPLGRVQETQERKQGSGGGEGDWEGDPSSLPPLPTLVFLR